MGSSACSDAHETQSTAGFGVTPLGSGLGVKWQEAVNSKFPCALNLCQVPFLCTDIESFLLQWGTWTN